MGADRYLVVDADAEHARSVSDALVSAGKAVVVSGSESEVPDADYALLIAAYDSIGPTGMARLLERFAPLRARGRVLLMTGSADRDALAVLFGAHGMSNILARNGGVDTAELLVTVDKILGGEMFGLERYFAHCEVRRQVRVRSSEQRTEAVDVARDVAAAIGAPSRFIELLCTAADELVSNALYNAPRDAEGRARYAELSRTVPVTLEEHEAAVVTLCSDGDRVGISVLDSFGSLQAGTITQYLAKCLRRGVDQVDGKAGGAGLGLFYVFEAVSHFVVNLDVGRRTEMIGMLGVRGRYRDFVARAKSFNVFVAGRS